MSTSLEEKVVTSEHDNAVVVVTLARPPVNSADLSLRRQLLAEIDSANATSRVEAMVITGGESTFCAGADINEFAKGLAGDAFVEPTLRTVVNAIEASRKPVVAAIAGSCLGGGLEIALACHARVASSNARFGLPEILLGLIPGAGGTQRLPRIVGVEATLPLILTGETIGLDRASALGLVREANGNLIRAAAELALRLASESQLDRPSERRARWQGDSLDEYLGDKLSALRRVSPAHSAAVRAVRASVETDLQEGLRIEAELFAQLMQTPESKALQYAFFSDRAAARIDDLPEGTPTRPIGRVAIVGAGTMGTGIAICAVNAGLPVTIIDQSAQAVERSLQTIRSQYEALVRRSALSASEMTARLNLISTNAKLVAAREADLIIEAAFEQLSVKQEIFRALDQHARHGAILASNTSTLDLNQIADATGRPGDVVGLHFFSPAHRMRLLEVVRGRRTSPEVLATAMSFTKRIGKIGVVAGVCDGFIGNRMIEEYMRQAYFLLEEGALPYQVDAALEAWGMAMGPFAVLDLAGGDIAWAIRRRRAVEQPDRPYSKLPDRVCELGRFGQKTGIGFYRYDGTARRRERDPEIDALVTAYSREIGVERRAISDHEIISRCILALGNEGEKLLAEGVAQRASDIDVVYRNGYGFPAYRGGPMFYLKQLGDRDVLARMEQFRAGRHGEFWEPAARLSERKNSLNVNRDFNI